MALAQREREREDRTLSHTRARQEKRWTKVREDGGGETNQPTDRLDNELGRHKGRGLKILGRAPRADGEGNLHFRFEFANLLRGRRIACYKR